MAGRGGGMYSRNWVIVLTGLWQHVVGQTKRIPSGKQTVRY